MCMRVVYHSACVKNTYNSEKNWIWKIALSL